MNFENIPEIRPPNGCFVVLGIMGPIYGLPYARFRCARWL